MVLFASSDRLIVLLLRAGASWGCRSPWCCTAFRAKCSSTPPASHSNNSNRSHQARAYETDSFDTIQLPTAPPCGLATKDFVYYLFLSFVTHLFYVHAQGQQAAVTAWWCSTPAPVTRLRSCCATSSVPTGRCPGTQVWTSMKRRGAEGEDGKRLGMLYVMYLA